MTAVPLAMVVFRLFVNANENPQKRRAKILQEFDAHPEARGLEHGDWLALLLECEATLRRQKRFDARACAAKPRPDAQVEDTDFRAVRGLECGLFFLKLDTRINVGSRLLMS